MSIKYVTQQEFDEFRESTNAAIHDLSSRVNGMEQAHSNFSIRLSGVETQLRILQTEVKGLRSDMQAGFTQLNARMDAQDARLDAQNAKMDIQYKELRHMMGFLITHLGFTLLQQIDETQQPEGPQQ